jgi:predicted adenylyl cyclase CyaB
MNEIEVKAKVHDQKNLMKQLENLGCVFSESIHQKDTIYIPTGETIPVPSGVNVLRIREQTGKFILTLKQPLTNQLDNIEKELEFSDPQVMNEIILLLGFEVSSSVEKTRRTSKYKDFEICVDEVVDLGTYIEVEKFGEDAEVIQKELFEFLETLGIQKEDQEFMGYDILLKNLNKEKEVREV